MQEKWSVAGTTVDLNRKKRGISEAQLELSQAGSERPST